jgi:hypothetical protein
MKTVLIILVALMALFTVPHATRAEDTGLTEPALVWSSGLIDADNTILYSITLAAGPKALKNVVISGVLPKDATFVEATWAPKDVTFDGEKAGTVSWKFTELAAQTFFGPFTVRVKMAGSDAKDFEAPNSIKATATWADGSAEGIISKSKIYHLAETGKIEITAKGTTDLVPVGETGIWIRVPADAVSKNVTLTFTRLPLTDKTDVPKVADQTWWCSLLSVTADQDVTFAQPLMIVMPTRRALIPMTLIPVFTQEAGKEWVLAGEVGKKDAAAEAATNAYGNSAFVQLKTPVFGTAARLIAVGVAQKVRVAGASSATSAASGTVKHGDDAPWF